ncbi:hypothetical protein GA0070611_1366 [Micromonospora auratinigra]|uniref:Uncharacterized protein n=2 Tax=Micromonospora auratinigra TaxID=261654 RepID=A0A1A8ZA82_9ACTN|nr:hypothetical protein GA0070611_1366 [Micromonospora auratinigra]
MVLAASGAMNAMYGVKPGAAWAIICRLPMIFWIGRPALPVTQLLLAVYLLVSRRVPLWTGVLLAAGAVLFPIARIGRIELVSIAVDLLTPVPSVYCLFRHSVEW